MLPNLPVGRHALHPASRTARPLYGLALVLSLAIVALSPLSPAVSHAAATLPAGFQESVVFSGLDHPTAVRFASDGRVFVAEKSGLIKVFDSLTDTTPTVFADLRTNVQNYWDRGLLGFTLDPNFPTKPYVYVLYTYDHQLGSSVPAPLWGDSCPTPPGATTDGCMVSARLSRLQAAGNVMTGSEQVLIEDWCQQFPSHSIGSLVFGADGALYVSAGDGASFNNVDYGQYGNTYAGDQANPCGDPPAGVGGVQQPPTAEGGALRSQSVRRAAGEPVSLDGAILRVDPNTGAGLADNPFAGSSNANARRIIAYGLRNPFRINTRPGTNEIWIGDVGWNNWEEIDRVANPTDSVVENFGWPCYEGNGIQSSYQAANLNLCTTLYNTPGAVTPPFFTYAHSAQIVPGESCTTGSSAITGIAFTFYTGGSYPPDYNGALFFADHSRNCIWAIKPGTSGLPDTAKIIDFVQGASNPVDLEIGPGGDLFYVDHEGGTIRRIQYLGTNHPPVAVIKATPTSGAAPLTVNFDGTGSSDPDPGDTLTYDWDLDGNGVFGDSTSSTPSYTYATTGSYTVQLRVTDNHGASSLASQVINVGNTPPAATIDAPPAGTTWKVGDVINFSGHATDAQDGTLPASQLSWSVILHHCPSDCHTHLIQTFTGVASGSFTAPDHEYPSYLEIQLTATDSGGLQDTKSLRLDPRTVVLTFQSSPSGLQLAVNSSTSVTSFSRTVIVGSHNSISAPSPQVKNGKTYNFVSWSDGGAQTHTITAGAAATTYAAKYRAR